MQERGQRKLCEKPTKLMLGSLPSKLENRNPIKKVDNARRRQHDLCKRLAAHFATHNNVIVEEAEAATEHDDNTASDTENGRMLKFNVLKQSIANKDHIDAAELDTVFGMARRGQRTQRSSFSVTECQLSLKPLPTFYLHNK